MIIWANAFAIEQYSPNDIQMLSDAPNHHVFCLLGPNAKSSNNPTILCAVQVFDRSCMFKDLIYF